VSRAGNGIAAYATGKEAPLKRSLRIERRGLGGFPR
jgi:hypothetical protein